MTFSIISTRDASLAHGVKCMIYGGAGAGKTRLIASAPQPLILSAEKGLLSLRQFNLPAIEIDGLARLNEAYNWLVSSQEARQFYTIALDSGSEIAEQVLNEEKRKTKDPRKGYGEMQDQLVALFRRLRDLPNRHVVMLAKQEYNVDGATGAKYWQPSFPGQKVPQAAPYFFDEVFQLVTMKDASGRSAWFLRTRPDNQNIAKDRSGVLAEWENADPVTGGGLTFLFDKMMRG